MPMSTSPEPARRGRHAEAARNDAAILDAAREVFVADPDAPISAVAKRAGVGIGALYNRYESKERLIATLCLDGEDIFIAEAERALANADDIWGSYVEFLQRIVDENTHAMSVRLAGRFTPTAAHLERAHRIAELGTALFERTRATGALRDDLTFLDVAFLLELLASSSIGDAERTRQYRQRQLSVIIEGIRKRPDSPPLPVSAPTWAEQEERWHRD